MALMQPLGGADLELGAYIPAALAVGRHDQHRWLCIWQYPIYQKLVASMACGLDTPLVPWFGGVYTRLDMTFANNWDFSLQYNNDSYFNSTGFARLTYRMGGSRRRNVPDQMEQPMFRNEQRVYH